MGRGLPRAPEDSLRFLPDLPPEQKSNMGDPRRSTARKNEWGQSQLGPNFQGSPQSWGFRTHTAMFTRSEMAGWRFLRVIAHHRRYQGPVPKGACPAAPADRAQPPRAALLPAGSRDHQLHFHGLHQHYSLVLLHPVTLADQHLQHRPRHGGQDIARTFGGRCAPSTPGLRPLEHEQRTIQPKV